MKTPAWDDRVSLAETLSNLIKTYNKLDYIEVARVGLVTVPAQVAVTLGDGVKRALSSLDDGTEVRLRVNHITRKTKKITVKVITEGGTTTCTARLR